MIEVEWLIELWRFALQIGMYIAVKTAEYSSLVKILLLLFFLDSIVVPVPMPKSTDH